MDEIKSFKDNQGSAANEHAKKLSKEKSQHKKIKPFKKLYTQKDGKVLEITVKPSGAYSTYLGTKKKLGEQYDVMMKKWKSENLFFSEFELDEVCSKIIDQLKLQEKKG